jgi:hydroxymethylpyrimidine pyrophosphatase-like HAD family hydrolase
MYCYFRAIAVDYDGTLTERQRPSDSVLASVRATRGKGMKVLLMTGRILEELRADFPAVDDEFDAIIGENGAVLWTPAGGERALAEPVARGLDAGLLAAGVPYRRGRVIVATDARYDQLVLEQITSRRLECQLTYNRGALMILPPGLSKGIGLFEALGELGISHHNTVGIGDAENDHSLLEFCELGVAVANAVPSLQERADIVLRETDGEGVKAFLDGPIISGELRLRPRRWALNLGTSDEEGPILLPASQLNVLIVGGSGQGKSFLAGLLIERLAAKGYAVCVLDPEGDHVNLEDLRGVIAVGGAEPLPSPERLETLLLHRFGSVVIDMSRLSPEEKRRQGAAFLTALLRCRARCGLPHWIVIEEAPQLMTPGDLARGCGAESQGLCLVTHRPQDLPPAVLDQVDVVLAVPGGETLIAELTHTPFAAAMGRGGPMLAPGEALWVEPNRQVRFRVGERQRPHVRHWHKYLYAQLPPGKRFHFRHGRGPAGEWAANIVQFHHEVGWAEAEVMAHHLRESDFSRWLETSIQDGILAGAVRVIESDYRERRITLEEARQRIQITIEMRYEASEPAAAVVEGGGSSLAPAGTGPPGTH